MSTISEIDSRPSSPQAIQTAPDVLPACLEMIEATPDFVVLARLDGSVAYLNRAARHMLGIALDADAREFTGVGLTPAWVRERTEREWLPAAMRDGTCAGEGAVLTRDGREIPVSFVLLVHRDAAGEPKFISTIARDLSDRKRAEASLARRAAEQAALHRLIDRLQRADDVTEIYGAALDALLDAVGCDRASVLLSDEAGVMRFVGWHGLSDEYRRAVEGHSPWRADDSEPRIVTIPDVMGADLDEELRSVVLREGLRALAFIPLVADGRLIGKFMVYYDAPHDFGADELELAITIARQLTFGLERLGAEESLRLADRRKDEFLATLAHELRNPLAPIRNATQILGIKGIDASTVDAAIEIINRQMGHMVRLVDDLLDVSRITRGKLELRPETVLLTSIIEQALEASRPHVDSAGHSLNVSLPLEPIRLYADPVRLAQVFSNLLNNACKYTERGGRIGLAAERDGREVEVRVQDSGVGIPPEHLPRVFEMFSQVDSTHARSQGGLGIGLALARGLVEMHGGSIEAQSDGPDRGTRFVIRLPILPAEEA